jgi:hypothetical protein
MSTVKYNFVIDVSDDELNYYTSLNEHEAAKTFSRGDLSWCLQSYLVLSKRGKFAVQCSNKLELDTINIIHSNQLLKLKGTPDTFIVCVRADYPKRRWAHHHIVQNKNQTFSNASFIPHWVQIGLLKRNPNRKDVLRVAYSGQTHNGNLAGSTNSWEKLFKPHGIEFVQIPASQWHDLSTVDVLIAIRSFDEKPHNTKPPTKLFNAWHAEIPLIAGYDSAFMQVGIPGEDYILAKTLKETLTAVLKLKNDPSFYNKIVQNGIKKASLYTKNTIAEIWEQTLANIVMKRHQKWQLHNKLEKFRFQLLLKAGLAEHNSKQIIKKLIH